MSVLWSNSLLFLCLLKWISFPIKGAASCVIWWHGLNWWVSRWTPSDGTPTSFLNRLLMAYLTWQILTLSLLVESHGSGATGAFWDDLGTRWVIPGHKEIDMNAEETQVSKEIYSFININEENNARVKHTGLSSPYRFWVLSWTDLKTDRVQGKYTGR